MRLPREKTKARAVVDTLADGKEHRWKELFVDYMDGGGHRSNPHYVSLTLGRVLKKHADRVAKGRYVIKPSVLEAIRGFTQTEQDEFVRRLKASDVERYDPEAICAACGFRWGRHYGEVCPTSDGRCPAGPGTSYWISTRTEKVVPALKTAENRVLDLETEVEELRKKVSNKEHYIGQIERDFKVKGNALLAQADKIRKLEEEHGFYKQRSIDGWAKVTDLTAENERLRKVAGAAQDRIDTLIERIQGSVDIILDEAHSVVNATLDMGEVSADLETVR